MRLKASSLAVAMAFALGGCGASSKSPECERVRRAFATVESVEQKGFTPSEASAYAAAEAAAYKLHLEDVYNVLVYARKRARHQLNERIEEAHRELQQACPR